MRGISKFAEALSEISANYDSSRPGCPHESPNDTTPICTLFCVMRGPPVQPEYVEPCGKYEFVIER